MHEQRTDAGGAAAQGGRIGEAVGATVGTAVEEAAHRAADVASVVAQGYGSVRRQVGGTEAGALVRHWAEVLEGVVEDGRGRVAAALVPPAPARRWPWSVGAALAGAVAGAAVVLVVRRLVGQDAPGAQEPEQLRAVVDSGPVPPPDR